LHGKHRHPPTQGAIEHYNRTIKDYLNNMYIEAYNKRLKFDLNKELSKSLDVYNNTKYITTGFSSSYIFGSNDKALFEKVKKIQLKAKNKLIIRILLILKIKKGYWLKNLD